MGSGLDEAVFMVSSALAFQGSHEVEGESWKKVLFRIKERRETCRALRKGRISSPGLDKAQRHTMPARRRRGLLLASWGLFSQVCVKVSCRSGVKPAYPW